MKGSIQTECGFPSGSRVKVKATAGPRLAGRTGTVIGVGYHPGSVRVILDGAKSPITLHLTYVVAIAT